MAAVMIPTASLELVLQTPDEVLAWVASLPPADRAEVSADWIARVQATEAGDTWALSFSIVERASGSAVGGCGFKGPPDAEGVVEVAYGIDPAHRGRGFATEAARALVEFAFASSRVRRVRAHTKPGNSASTVSSPSAASGRSARSWTPRMAWCAAGSGGRPNQALHLTRPAGRLSELVPPRGS